MNDDQFIILLFFCFQFQIHIDSQTWLPWCSVS